MAKKDLAEVELAKLLVDANISGADELTVTILGGALTMASTKGATHAQVAMARQEKEASLAGAQQAHKNQMEQMKTERINALIVFHVEKSKGHNSGCTCKSCDFLMRHS